MFDYDEEDLSHPTEHECWAHAEPLEFPDRFGDYYCSICGEHLNSKKKMEEPKRS